MRQKKFYTVKQWKKFYKNQEFMCEKFDIILTDHKTRRELIINVLQKINLKNIDNGIATFNKIIQDFGDSMEKVTGELNEPKRNNVKIWSDISESSSQTKDQANLEKIWGKKK